MNNKSVNKHKTPDALFLKVYIKDFKDEGLLAALRAERFHTLMGLALFMNNDKTCYPSQKTLSKILGLSITQTNKRIKQLFDFEWKGKGVISFEKQRNIKNGRWDNNFYFIFEHIGLAIFNKKG